MLFILTFYFNINRFLVLKNNIGVQITWFSTDIKTRKQTTMAVIPNIWFRLDNISIYLASTKVYAKNNNHDIIGSISYQAYCRSRRYMQFRRIWYYSWIYQYFYDRNHFVVLYYVMTLSSHPQHQMTWEDFQQRALAKDQPVPSWQ